MSKIRLTKQFTFEAAHALWNYDGKCKNLHGHSYIFYVTVIGKPIKDDENKKKGMVIDFGDLKKIVKKSIIDVYDHAVVFNKEAPYSEKLNAQDIYDKKVLTTYQPTCENMVDDFAKIIKSKLPEGVKLHSLKLHETATSFAEWYASDNE